MPSEPIYRLRNAEVFSALETSWQGLASAEAPARQALYGKNLLQEIKTPPLWRKFLEHATQPLALVLWGSGAIALGLGEAALGEGKSILGLVIWLLVLVNAAFSLWREYRTQQAMLALRKLLPDYARVLRDGVESSIPASDLAPGDLLVLAEGDHISADARVVEAYGLRINSATLTGEAMPSLKTADASLRDGISEIERPNLVFAGTSVTSGTGKAVVYSTGMTTQFGRIAHLTLAFTEKPSLLQEELLRLTRKISLVAAGLSGLVFLVGVVDVHLGWGKAFLLALGVLVAAVPEGLAATLTLSLSVAGQRLAQRGVLVKKLSVIETLGMVSTLCTDKNGTLTQNQMTVREIWTGRGRWIVSGSGYDPAGKISAASEPPGVPRPAARHPAPDLQLLVSAALLCNNARLRPPTPERPQWSYLGDQTEAAMRAAALKFGFAEQALLSALPRFHELPFDANRKRMTTIHRLEARRAASLAGQLPALPGLLQPCSEVAFVKGAPREVLQMCSAILVGDCPQPLDDSARAEIAAAVDAYAGSALRVLALAFRCLPPRAGVYTVEKIEQELVFLGLMAMHDPPRPGVPEAIRACRSAGIRLIMVTGDYGLTAVSLARRVGMLTSAQPVIVNGADFEQMDRGQLDDALQQEVIFARMAPEHKLRLVAALQERDEVVAVTGDGVNDAPALRKADLGISMGISGTDVAREAADIILIDDDFANIALAIGEGRAVFDNLRKFITYIFSSNVAEVAPFIVTALTGLPLALNVAQILAIDLGTDMLPGLALGTEKPEPDVMQRPPRHRSQPLVDRGLLQRSFLWLGPIETLLAYSGFLLVLALAGQLPLPDWGWLGFIDRLGNITGLRALGRPHAILLAVTIFHAGVVMAQVGNAFACRTEKQRGRTLGWLSNRSLLLSIAVEIGLILCLIYVPGLAAIFDHRRLPGWAWMWLAAFPVALYGLDWMRKSIQRR